MIVLIKGKLQPNVSNRKCCAREAVQIIYVFQYVFPLYSTLQPERIDSLLLLGVHLFAVVCTYVCIRVRACSTLHAAKLDLST